MDQADESQKAVRVRFEGRVQGVGFRYTAAQLARDFHVSGWVRNDFDGTVEMVAAASEERLDLFLQALQERMKDHIRRTHQQPTTLSTAVKGFEIRH